VRTLLLLTCGLLLLGCQPLTPEQAATLDGLNAQLSALDAKAKGLVQRHEAGKLTTEELAAALTEVAAARKPLLAAVRKLEALGTPWYHVAWSIFKGLPWQTIFEVALGGSGASLLVMLLRTIRGVEARDNKATKEAIAAAQGSGPLGRFFGFLVQRVTGG
jgi:hypothetical protein